MGRLLWFTRRLPMSVDSSQNHPLSDLRMTQGLPEMLKPLKNKLFFICVVMLSVMGRPIAASIPLMDGTEHGEVEHGEILIDDDFNRQEENNAFEQIGNGWGTNSKKRAKGVKQVDLVDGAMRITRAKVADHGVSVFHEAAFKDAVVSLRFQLSKGDDLGINIADMNEKTVHAGHICVARLQLNKLEIKDLKTGSMELARRKRRQNGAETPEDKKRITKTTTKKTIKLEPDRWHELEIRIVDDQMIVKLNGDVAGMFSSEGIAHSTKSRLRLSVNQNAWVDNVKLVRLK